MKINKRRRIEGKTDYKKRMRLLKSEAGRIIFRKTNKYIIGQYVKSKEAQDFVSRGIESRILLKYGWPKEAAGSLKSLPACYLTGLLLGRKIIDKEGKIKAALDIGLIRNTKKSKIYAFLKGLIDAGIDIPNNAEFPDENRISGRHLKKNINFEKIKEKIKNE
ncbi:50S ribosomal protein L18 [Candidatus Pacearchaeota archaeon]|nr:50S ribosomal protein L18 [Candidatus Pacearchaeota archaeon]